MSNAKLFDMLEKHFNTMNMQFERMDQKLVSIGSHMSRMLPEAKHLKTEREVKMTDKNNDLSFREYLKESEKDRKLESMQKQIEDLRVRVAILEMKKTQ